MGGDTKQTSIGRRSRTAAVIIALLTWTVLALPFGVAFARTGSGAESLWRLLDYFTIITNFFVAVPFSGIALGNAQFSAPRLIAGATLAVLLVFIKTLGRMLQLPAFLADAMMACRRMGDASNRIPSNANSETELVRKSGEQLRELTKVIAR